MASNYTIRIEEEKKLKNFILFCMLGVSLCCLPSPGKYRRFRLLCGLQWSSLPLGTCSETPSEC